MRSSDLLSDGRWRFCRTAIVSGSAVTTVEDLTLAQTGRLLGEHEATVSRQLARSRKVIRAEVERHLRAECGLTDAEIARCFECTIDDPGTLDVGELFSLAGARKDSEAGRSQ